MLRLPKDIFTIVTDFAYGFKIEKKNLIDNILQTVHIRDSIGDAFLSLSAFDTKIDLHVPNPYRNFSPYHPTIYLDKSTLTSNALICIGHCLHKTFYERLKTYRMVFLRTCRKFSRGEFRYFNRLLTRWLIHINFLNDELTYLDKGQQKQIQISIDQSRPLSLLHI